MLSDFSGYTIFIELLSTVASLSPLNDGVPLTIPEFIEHIYNFALEGDACNALDNAFGNWSINH